MRVIVRSDAYGVSMMGEANRVIYKLILELGVDIATDRQTYRQVGRQSSPQAKGRQRAEAKMDMNIVLNAMSMGGRARRKSSVVHRYCKMRVLNDRMNIYACGCANGWTRQIK